ncbi:4Fe-4S dicluster domain-containing protein [Desulfomarina sp.]
MTVQGQQKKAESHLLHAAREFQKCMQCGKCRSVCPVFKEIGNELYVARGKNKLAEKIVSGDLQITSRVKDAINECLNCKTCSANCPAGVSPEHVVLRLRWYITTREGLGLFKALIFRQLLWRKWPVIAGAVLIGLIQRLLLDIGPGNPVRHLFPLFGTCSPCSAFQNVATFPGLLFALLRVSTRKSSRRNKVSLLNE